MQVSGKGINLIRHFEGLELEAYPDPATGGEPYTIGYGHTGSDVYLGLTITEEKALELLSEDLRKFEKAVNDKVKVDLTQDQFDALVSFTYNCGPTNLAKSTLLKKLNKKDYQGAADEFPKWRKANGKVMKGLERRRAAERALFLGRVGGSVC